MKEPSKNLAVSVHQRLLNSARQNGEDFNQVLAAYAVERLLYRLSESSQRERFVIKGAALYALWQRENSQLTYRPTRDLDLWGSGSPQLAAQLEAFREILETPVEDDGLEFRPADLRGEMMREHKRYEGCRLHLMARLGNAQIPMQIDLSFGDAITPAPSDVDYPTRLPFPAPRLRAYPRETVVAEKFEALVSLALTNTRMKDFFDLWALASGFDFEGETLQSALGATFARRGTALPDQTPLALTPRFSRDAAKVGAWRAFIKRSSLGEAAPLDEVARLIEAFMLPPSAAARRGNSFSFDWLGTSGWTPKATAPETMEHAC